MQRAIITGATGAVGMALIKELIMHHIEVLVLTRPGSCRNDRIPAHPLVSCRNCSLEQLCVLKNDTGKQYDVFYHLAWAGTFGADRNNMYLQNQNVKYALDAVAAAKRFGCRCYIGAGSQAEYGRCRVKLSIDTPAFPDNGYGYAKLCAGQMTRDYAGQLGMDHIWVRILSIYGPYDGDNSMVMSAVNQLRNGIPPKLTKGEQEWDYLYSADAARALRMMAERGGYSKTYVLGSGQTRRLSDYAEDIRNVVNPNVDIQFGAVSYKENQVMYLCADTKELEADFGFSPRVSFVEGIKEIEKWKRASEI